MHKKYMFCINKVKWKKFKDNQVKKRWLLILLRKRLFQNQKSFLYITRWESFGLYSTKETQFVCLFKLYNIKRSLGRGFNIYFTLYFWLLCSTTRDIFSLYCTRQKKPTKQTNKKQKRAKIKSDCTFYIYFLWPLMFLKTNDFQSLMFFHNFFFIEKAKAKKPRFGANPVVLGT